MANFAVAASMETIERANKVMEMYAQTGDKKEDILIRILDLAESESIKGTHPELESSLKAVDGTIGVLIKQINGIVAGQDSQMAEVKGKLDVAIEEKRNALEQAKKKCEEAQLREEAADQAIRQASADIEEALAKAQESVQTAEREAAIVVEKSNMERDQAIRERDDARTIAAEKTASNDLLMRQMAAMEQDVTAYKSLQETHKQLAEEYSSCQIELERKKESFKRLQDKVKELQAEHKDIVKENVKLQEQLHELNKKMVQDAGMAALVQERAVIEKEREMQSVLRQSDKENARLQAKIEQLESQVLQLMEVKSNANKK